MQLYQIILFHFSTKKDMQYTFRILHIFFTIFNIFYKKIYIMLKIIFYNTKASCNMQQTGHARYNPRAAAVT